MPANGERRTANGERNNRNRMHDTRPNPLARDDGYRPRQHNADRVHAWRDRANRARFDGPNDLCRGHHLAATNRHSLGTARIAPRSAA
ncbi:hypothetical protein C41B8_06422 [Salinisphaera hydrothermalis C41B8]|uniref:Uncharacterized protein n=1 Tax=Salinisphaera hydrothermalis (strain C41B8) TaxID=1304275 RepID=A0A084INB4_SALHC|nr:hypothetical protein C41B8_06422 [Salinisphaera hydrothermalis C41B8]